MELMIPGLNKWVIVIKGDEFFKAKRSGSSAMWIWRFENGNRALPKDIQFWLLPPEIRNDKEEATKE